MRDGRAEDDRALPEVVGDRRDDLEGLGRAPEHHDQPSALDGGQGGGAETRRPTGAGRRPPPPLIRDGVEPATTVTEATEPHPSAVARDCIESSASARTTASTTSASSRASQAPRASAASAYTWAAEKATSREYRSTALPEGHLVAGSGQQEHLLLDDVDDGPHDVEGLPEADRPGRAHAARSRRSRRSPAGPDRVPATGVTQPPDERGDAGLGDQTDPGPVLAADRARYQSRSASRRRTAAVDRAPACCTTRSRVARLTVMVPAYLYGVHKAHGARFVRRLRAAAGDLRSAPHVMGVRPSSYGRRRRRPTSAPRTHGRTRHDHHLRPHRDLPVRAPPRRSATSSPAGCTPSRISSTRRPAACWPRSASTRGWRCLEVAAGTGSVAAWLADQVGPEGEVFATDVDLTHLVSCRRTSPTPSTTS